MSLKDTLNLIKGANPLKPNMLGCWKQQQEKGEFVILGFLKTRKTNQNQKNPDQLFSLYSCVGASTRVCFWPHLRLTVSVFFL